MGEPRRAQTEQGSQPQPDPSLQELLLGCVLDAINDGILVVDASGALIFSNPAARRILPITEAAIPLDHWPAVYGLHGSDGVTLLEPDQLPVARALRGEAVEGAEIFVGHGDLAEGRWISVRAMPIAEPKGAAVMILHDVTEARRAQETLRQERDWASTIIDTVGSLVVVLDREGRIVNFNRACELLTGYCFEEVIGRRVWELFLLPEEATEVRAVFERLREGLFPSQHENHWVTRTGERRLIMWSNTALVDRTGQVEYVIGTGIDVTERRLLEQQLRQAQKMEALGRLAGGMVHDFNNLLTIISGYAQMLADGLAPGDPLRDQTGEILKAAGTAAELTRRLLTFSRKQPSQTRLVDLNALIEGMEKMLRRLLGEDIELVTVLSPELGKVRADPVHMEQVLMNLVVNSREAMPKGGRIVVETARVNLDDDYARAHLDARVGPHVMLAVSDTGHGMQPEVLRQVFDPFFTTKEKGTGLGLSTVYGIVRQHGGRVTVYSEPGLGTTFKVYLPAVEEAAELAEEPGVPEAVGEGAGTILVAEDQPELRRMIVEMLNRAGYSVLSASNADEAVRLCREYPGAVDLLLTDVVMPRMSGQELAARLIGLRPGLRVLYMSGYTDKAIVKNGILKQEAPFLEKPFTKQALLAKVREVLGHAAGPPGAA